MKDIKLKVKQYTNNVNIIDNWDLNIKFFNAMIFAFVLVFILYAFLLTNMFLDLAERKRLDNFAYNLSDEISVLETEYLASANQVNFALSSEMGFEDVKPKFVTKNKSIGKLSIARNEI